ncbi:MAG: ABC transporter substrate-binding protein, partial [Pseudomonadota bacterium]
AGELDAALLLTEGAVADILNGSDNRLISVYVDSPIIWGIHVAAGSDLTDIGAIRGKRYAISRHGSGSHLIAIVDAAERGLPTAGMTFETVGSLDGAREALASGNADVFLWEKHTTQPLVDAGEFRRIGERAVPWPAFVVSARRDYLAEHADVLSAVLRTVRDFAARLKTGADSAELVSRRYGIKTVDVEAWLEHVEWSRDARCPDDALRRAVDALTAEGVLTARTATGIDEIWQTP